MKNRFLNALCCNKVDRPPVWFMRQAGRYLSEYRLLRFKSGNFFELCYSSELIALATLQPLKRYDLDAVIIFSDILLLPAYMGLNLKFVDNFGPIFLNPVRNINDIKLLNDIFPSKDFNFLLKAIKIIVYELNDVIPLLGFSGTPWTLAVYMIEGKITKNFSYIKKFLYTNSSVLHILLKKLEINIVSYLCAQIDFGVKVLVLFDTWGGILTPFNYKIFSLNYVINIINQVNLYKKIPFIFFGRNINNFIIEELKSGNLSLDAIGFDWSLNLDTIVKNIPNNIVIQGNLDPSVLYGDHLFIIKEINNIMKICYNRNGYIFNLGHGIYPDIDPYSLELIINTIDRYKNF
ncbi:MAG TPA: uroporphyrinogen decarboxylase [Candidatus Azosocius sp. HAIN]